MIFGKHTFSILTSDRESATTEDIRRGVESVTAFSILTSDRESAT